MKGSGAFGEMAGVCFRWVTAEEEKGRALLLDELLREYEQLDGRPRRTDLDALQVAICCCDPNVLVVGHV